ncbi:MAG: type I-C CRISPR-associated protein Cas8c/Csd1 [Planctomycetota bacterium]
MLHALLDYAQQAGISAEAGFRPKRVRWLLQFTSNGDYRGVFPASNDRNGYEFPVAPHLQFSGKSTMRQFLVDTAQHAVLYGVDELDETQRAKHEYFIERLRDAADVEPVLGRIADALDDADTLSHIRADLDNQTPKVKPSDNVTFVEMAEAGPRIIVEQATWHDWWRSYWPTLFQKKEGKSKAKAKTGASMRCFLSGELVQPARTHPKIKGLGDVGGNVETTLVGFNCEAFCSHGLKQSANAAMSTDAAETYAAALNQLIATQSKRLAGARVVYWYTHDVPPEEDPINLAFDFGDAEVPDTDAEGAVDTKEHVVAQAVQRAGELVTAIRTGERPDLRGCRYRAMTLSGNAGRVVVRDWMEGRFEDLAERVDRWFSDLRIIHRHGQGLAPPPKFLAVLAATVRTLKDVPSPLEAALWRSAITGGPIPFEAMARALRRVHTDVIKDNPANHARMGLLKAYLIRKEICQMSETLNEYETHPAYLCGRIMAVLAAIQYRALPRVRAGVVQRYYAAASATPALVLGRLIRLAQTGHLPKIMHDSPGLAHWFDNELAKIWTALDQRVPRTLTLEEQSLFAMGYYQQKAKRGPASQEDITDTIDH